MFRENKVLASLFRALLSPTQNRNNRKYWNKQPKDLTNEVEQSRTILARMEMETSGELVPIRYKQIHLSVCNRIFPRVEVFLPGDDSAHKVFEYLGCPVECQNYAVNQ